MMATLLDLSLKAMVAIAVAVWVHVVASIMGVSV